MRIKEDLLIPATTLYAAALVVLAIVTPDDFGTMITLGFIYLLSLVGEKKEKK